MWTLDKEIPQSVFEWGMSDAPTSNPDTIGHLDALIKHIRDLRSRELAKFDLHLANLEDIRASFAGPREKSSVSHEETRGKKEGYYRCRECQFCFYKKEGLEQHKCREHPNSLEDEDLDAIHGKDGWEVIAEVDPPADESPNPARIERLAQPEPVQAEPLQLSRTFLPRAHGLRPNSKRDRVFQFLKESLGSRESMHVDEILEQIRLIDDFKDMKRTTLFNILSQLKSKGLLVSDNRGNWALR
jgi:hypothetical protein